MVYIPLQEVNQLRAGLSFDDLGSEYFARGILGLLEEIPSGSDPNNSTIITPSWGAAAVYTGSWTKVDEAGSFFVFVLSYSPFDTVAFPVIQWSADGVSVDSFAGSPVTTTIPLQTITQLGITYYLGIAVVNAPFMRSRYYRLNATNGATLSTAFYAISGVGKSPAVGSIKALTDPLNNLSVAQLVQSVIAGTNPDGNFVNQGVLGTKTLSPVTSVLGIAGVYTSDWIDCENYPNFKLLVTADVASADSGVRFNWSDSATGPARTFETRTFRTTDATAGKLLVITTRARYLQIVYTNGTVVQTRFFLNLRLNTIPIASDVSLVSATAGNTGQQTVGLVSSLIAYPALAGRKSVRLKNMSTSARPLIYGFSGSLSFANGDELAVGEAIDLDIDDSVTLYVVTNSTGGAGVQASYTEIA